MVTFPLNGADVLPPGSVSMVLSFRDLHEWMALGDAQQALATIYRVLAPGGVFGVVDNRGESGRHGRIRGRRAAMSGRTMRSG